MADEQDDDAEVLEWAGSIVGLIKWAESIGELQIYIEARAGLRFLTRTRIKPDITPPFGSTQFVPVN